MAQNVGTAKVTIEADFSNFEKDMSSYFGKAGDEAGDALEKGVKDGTDKAADHLDGVGDAAESAAKDASGAFGDVGKAAGKAGEDASKRFGDGVDGVGDSAQKAGEKAGKSFDGISRQAGKAGSDSAQRFGVGISGVGGSMQAAAQSASTRFGSLVSSAGNAGRGASQAMSNGLAGMGAAAQRAMSSARSQISAGSAQIASSARSMGESMRNAFQMGERAAGRIPAAARTAGTALLAIAGPAAILKGGFDRLMGIQRAEIIFKNIGLSADETGKQMDRLSDQVTGTSVSLADAAKYSAMFAQSGVELGKPMDSAIDAFTSLSSIAEGSGVDVGRVMQQISAQGKVTGEDIMQMSDAGVNATKYLADSMGMSQADIKKAISDGEVSFEDFVKAVNDGTGDLAQQMGQTLPAKLSNMRTAFSNLGATILTPIIPLVTAGVTGLTTAVKNSVSWIQSFTGWLNTGGPAADALKVALIGLGTAITVAVLPGLTAMAAGWVSGMWASSSLLSGISTFIAYSKAFWGGALGIVKGLGVTAAAWVKAGAAAAAQGAVVAGRALLAAPGYVASLIGQLGRVVAAWATTAAAAVVQGAKAGTAWLLAAPKNMAAFMANFPRMVAGWVSAAAAATVNAAKIAVAWIMAAPKNIATGAVALGAMAAQWARAGVAALVNGAKIAAGWLIALGPIGLVIGAVAGVIALFATLWVKVEGFRNFFVGMWDGLVSVVTGAWDMITGAIMGAWNALTECFTGGGSEGLWSAVVGGAQTAWETLTMIWSGAVEFFSGVFSGIATVISTAWTGISTAFLWVWDTVLSPIYTWIANTWGRIWELLGPPWDMISQKMMEFGGWLSGFWTGAIWPVLSMIIGWFQRLGATIGAFISQHWSVLKPILIALGTVLLAPIVAGLGLVVGAIAAVVAIVGVVVAALTGFVYVLMKLPGWIAGVVSAVGGWFARMWQNIKDVFNRSGAAIGGFYSNHVATLPGKVGSAIGSVISWFGSLPGKIKASVSGAGRWLVSTGGDIIRGLKNGLEDKVKDIGTWFLDKLPGFIRKPFEKVMGIGSPSRVFAQYGVFIGEGLVNGLDSMKGQVQAASEGMAGAAKDIDLPEITANATVAPSLAPAVAPRGAPAAGAGAGGESDGLSDAIDPAVVTEAANVADVAYSTAAANMLTTATSTLVPMWAQQEASMQSWGLTAQTQASTMVNPALASTGLAATTTNLTQFQPAMLGMRTAMTSTGLTALNMNALQFQPAMLGLRTGISNTAMTTRLQTSGVMNPALGSVGTTAWNVLNGSVNPALSNMRGAVAHTADSFRVGANNIAVQWNRVRSATADPARFAINTVFNDGIVGMWNSVSALLGTKKMVPYPARFAAGGYVRGRGGPKDDKIPALLSNKEYVLDAATTKRIGPDNLKSLQQGNASVAPGVLRDPRERKGFLNDKTMMNAASRYQGGGLAQGTPAWKALLRGYNWARSRNGRPYVWGGSANGAGGADCSGFMSGIADVILGGSGARQWATMSFPGTQGGAWGPGLASGFSVGISSDHTAGTIGGVPGMPAVNVESGGANSRMKFGTSDAAGANDSQFNRRHHLIVTDGGTFMPGRGSGASMGDIVGGIMKPFQDKMKAATAAWSRKPGEVNQVPAAVADKLGGAATKKIQKLAEEMMSDPGGSGVERWRPMAKRAMARVGFDYNNPRQVNAMMSQIASESSGNPRAIQNGYVDVNTGGNEAVGLLQIAKGTWPGVRDPALPDDRMDPFANMVGALRYYKGKYGMDLTTMWGHGHGYDLGGEMVGEGLFAKKTTEAERVLSPRQTQSFSELVDFLSGSGWDDFVRATGAGRSSSGSGVVGAGREVRVAQVANHFHGPVGTTEAADTINDKIAAKAW